MLPLISGAASAATVVTAIDGNVKASDEQLMQSDVVSSADEIVVEGSGIASLMVADSAIVKMCHGASLGFGEDQGSGPSALNLRTGQLKVSAEKRASDNPLEIHTPAAIATLLGTELLVEVDPTTGDTIFTSLDHDIRVNAIDSPDAEGFVISPGQSITVRKGMQPDAVENADLSAIEASSHCMDAERFRIAAVSSARNDYGQQSLSQIAAMDVEVDLPTVAAGPPVIPTGTLSPPTFFPVCISAIQCSGATAGNAPGFFPSDPEIVGPPPPPVP